MTPEEVPPIPVMPLPIQDAFASVRGQDGEVYILHTVQTPLGEFAFLRPREYHMTVMSNGRKAAGGATIEIAKELPT